MRVGRRIWVGCFLLLLLRLSAGLVLSLCVYLLTYLSCRHDGSGLSSLLDI
jgi:hypothetical protein